MSASKIAQHARVLLPLAFAFAMALSGPGTALAWSGPTDHGGPVQTGPEIYIDFWGPGWSKDPLGERSYLINFVNSINGSRWLETLGQYRVGWHHTTYKGSWSDPDPSHRPGPNPSTPATQAEATRAAHHFGVGNNHNITIIIALPYGGTCNPYHHWDSDVGVAFVAYPYNGDRFAGSAARCAGGAQTVSHEIAEAMTDPEVGSHPAWYPEVADGPCQGDARSVQMPNGKSFYVQALWSNSANRCVFGS